MALVSFDDFPPPGALLFLTATLQPASEIGHTALRLLLERLANPAREPREIIMAPHIVRRHSCGCRHDEQLDGSA